MNHIDAGRWDYGAMMVDTGDSQPNDTEEVEEEIEAARDWAGDRTVGEWQVLGKRGPP